VPDLNPLPRPPLLKTRIASGLVVLIPLVITVAFVRFVFDFTSGILLPVIDPAFADWPALARAAISLLILLVLVYLLGALAANIVGRRVLALGEGVVLRLPLVKSVYSVSKQVVAAFQGQGTQAFKSVVFVEFPHPGMRAVGFVTSEMERGDGSIWNTVFVPTTPNPTTGFLQLVPRDSLEQTGFTVEGGIKMVISLGVLVPE
jgi:uncharacterized membrane protein